MKKRLTCRCCKSKDLFLYLDLGLQPLANTYTKKKTILPTYPLEVMVCRKCFHSQLSIVVNPDDMFKNYLYVSGTTDTFRHHCELLAKDAVKRIKGVDTIRVLDIACNDGTQLEYFRTLGCIVQGVDPAKNLRKITKEKNIPVIVDYWTQSIAKKFKKPFHLITATNVFAHVNDTEEFLKASAIALDPDGILIIEFPYGEKLIEHNEFDTVYHEHLSYFLVHSFATLATRMNFHIVDILQTNIHGGSIRFFLKKGKGKHSQKVTAHIAYEKKKGLLKLTMYKAFSKRIIANKNKLQSLVNQLQNQGKRVIGYGASAKGNTMLNYVKLNLDYIVDDNSLKWNYFTPGQNIPIYSPAYLKQDLNELNIIVLSWNFFKEIAQKVHQLRKTQMKDKFIMYVPTVKLYTYSEAKNFRQSA